MSEVSDQVRNYISQYLANVGIDHEKASQISQKLAHLIESKSLKLIELVKSLGDYLTADDDLLRPKATSCLASTIKHLPSSALSPNDIQVLNTFFVSKISDLKSTKEALIGLSSLIEKDNFGTGNIKEILHGLQTYDSKDHLASTRFFTFEILEKLLTKFEKYILKFLNEDFVETFIHVASGEKDPKNLLSSFNLNSKISSLFDIEESKDELFDILFCYFPISFKPPKDDPYKITSDQLKSALRNAISTSSHFAKDAYPNLLEKLSSTSPTVKRDTIETITACIENYGHESIVSHWVELWNGLKFEILHGDQDDDEDGIFALVLNCLKTISKSLSTHEETFQKFYETISQELYPNIKEHKSVKQTTAIFAAVASSSPHGFNIVANGVLSLIFLNTKDLNLVKQRALITQIGMFTSAYIEVFGTFDDVKAPSQGNSLLEFKDDILITLGKTLMGSSKVEVSLRTLSIAELTKVATLADFLIESELSLIVQYFTESILADDNDYIYNSGIGGLIQISKINTSLLLDVTFPTLLSLLPEDETENISINNEEKPKEKVFDIMSALSMNREIADYLVIRLLTKLSEVGTRPNNIKYSYQIGSTLRTVLETSQQNKRYPTDSYLKKNFKDLVQLLMTADDTLNDDNVVDVLSDVAKLMVIYSSKDFHQDLLTQTFALFTGRDAPDSSYYGDIPSIDILESPNKLVNLFTRILAGVDKSVEIPQKFIDVIINYTQITNFESDYVRLGYLQLISLLVNKWVSDSSAYTQLPLDLDTRVEIFTWVTKGVILKIDPSSEVFIDRLLALLSDKSLGHIATKSFEILVVDLSIFDKFKKINNNNVRLLYKQKFIQLFIPKLVSCFKSAESLSTKSNYLSALSYVLKHTKRELINPHLSLFFPLLLQSLSLPNSEVRLASVRTILSAVDEVPELISSHLQTLIPSLLSMTQCDTEKLNTPDVRLVSLNCLQSLTYSTSLEKLVPFQAQIIRTLEKVLDDKKRSVRKGAVDARQAFYELGRSAIE